MAFKKTANASLVTSNFTTLQWQNFRDQAKGRIKIASDKHGNLIHQASEIFQQPFNPEDYLLTHCFPAGHMVLMGDGTEKPIENIREGDLVLTHEGNIRPVTRLLRREVDENLVVVRSAQLSEVACTAEHPFYAIRRENSWCRVFPSYEGQVKCTFGGKQVCERTGCSTNGAVPDWIAAEDLREGDLTYTPSLHETRIDPELNPNRMRLLGYYTAEGRVDKQDGRPNSIRFALHDDELDTLAPEICRLMQLEFGISSHSIIKNKKRATEEGDKGVIIAFDSYEHAPWFLRHGGIGSRTKRLSMAVMTAPVAWQRQLIGAWINGDGCYDGLAPKAKDKRGIRISTSSDDLASQAMVLLDRMEIHSTLTRVHNPEHEFLGRVIAASDGWHIGIPRSYLPKLDNVVKWKVEGLNKKRMSTKERYRYVASSVSRIKKISRRHFSGTVYNLSVQDDESYVVNRQAVHNCTIVCSVDTEKVSGVKTGSVIDDGQKINRKWDDYRITSSTDPWINNNLDAWSRQVITASAHTFIGAQNFVEHVQVEDLSKGRIIDAAIRDIGPSLYVDILVATARKHNQLIQAIESGKLGTLSMGCFLAGTMVTMADGTRVAIEDVAPGDMVLTHQGRGREVLNKQIKPYKGELRHIRAVGMPSTINATANHGFQAICRSTTCACGCGEPLPTNTSVNSKFKRGHDKRIFNPNGTYSLDEMRRRKEEVTNLRKLGPKKVRADELRKGDFLCFPRAQFSSIPNGWTTNHARLIGFFLAEGSFLKRKGDPVEVQFNFSMDEKETYVAEVCDLLQSVFPDENSPWVQDRPEQNTCAVHLCSRKVAAWFKRHCGEYSHRKRLSEEAMQLPDVFHRFLVGSWIGGDGTFGEANGTLSGTTCSYDLACQMHMLMAKFGVFSRFECVWGGKSVEISEAVVNGEPVRHPETGRLPAFTLCIGRHQMDKLVGYNDKAKGSKVLDRTGTRVLDDYVIFPITDIETSHYEGSVHNMEVEEDHTYVVEGVAVHNCSVLSTICTKCGNVAADEADLCSHVKFLKGNKFYDELGRPHRVAELCGHHEMQPTGGVHFIEASWVESPAFQGAVMRNILETPASGSEISKRAEEVLNSLPPQWSDQGFRAAASTEMPTVPNNSLIQGMSERNSLPTFSQDATGAPPLSNRSAFNGFDDEEEEGAKEEGESPYDKAKEEVYKALMDEAKERAINEIRKKEQEEAMSEGELETSLNDTLQKSGRASKEAYRAGLVAFVRTARSDADLLDNVALFNRSLGIDIPVRLYRTALRVGALHHFPTTREYLSACRKCLGMNPNETLSLFDRNSLLRLGHLLQLRSQAGPQT